MYDIEIEQRGDKVEITFWRGTERHRFGTTVALDAMDVINLQKALRGEK